MQTCKEITQAATWVDLLTQMERHPRLIGILQSSGSLARQFSACCQHHDLMSFCTTTTLEQQLMAETIAASGCDTLISDRQHYDLLIYILSLQHKPMTIILNQECWTPDWCWQLPRHRFLCQQDLD
ncbi:hypothetical protein MD588_12905 [Photobacterium sp. SDRW27]|uniref:hypothetical protein n=1 Tax=Photobacterium obscurum TaxID=2829490 RepID=UPI002242C6CB|nr:hypothetical protein [Photobacterium obscurum]MCW8329709.1 hypothetical protein [Photobacterium obscurum]